MSSSNGSLNANITIDEVNRINSSSYEWSIVNSTVPANLSSFINGTLSVAGGNQVTITNTNISNLIITTNALNIPFTIIDDDAPPNTLLPVNLLQNNYYNLTMTAYSEAYILAVVDGGGNLNNNGSIPFTPDLGSSAILPHINQLGRRQSLNNESDVFWVVYVSSVFQSGSFHKDNDADAEYNQPAGINQGGTITYGSSPPSTSIVSRGGDVSVIPFENFRDTGANAYIQLSIAHEIGHQFGFNHVSNTVMNKSLNGSTSNNFNNNQLSLLRSRHKSPGQK